LSQTQTAFEFGPFRLDGEARTLFRDAKPVPLTPKPFDLLMILVANAGRAITKESLMRQLWPETAVEEGNLAVAVFAARKALGDTGEPPLIETIPRVGYRFNGEVRAAEAVAGPVQSVAILPFRPFITHEEDMLLGIGMADAVITRLSQCAEILVRPTGAVAMYVGTQLDPVEAGRTLKVDAVLEGYLQRAGGQVRVTVKLLRVRDGHPLWADRYHVSMQGLFDVQDAIAESVGAALIERLTEASRARLRKRYTGSADAYEAYVWGCHCNNQRTLESCRRAIEHFEQAIKVDPDYALAYAGIGDACSWTSHFYLPPAEVVPRARECARIALGLDEKLGEAHAVLAEVKRWFDWDFEGAGRHYRRAIELNPGHAYTRLYYSIFLAQMGDPGWEREVAAMHRLDPVSNSALCGGGVPYYYTRRHAEALELQQRCLDALPVFWVAEMMSAWSHAALGQHGAAVGFARRAIEHSSGSHVCQATLGYCLACAGDRPGAAAVLESLNLPSAGGYSSPYYRAIIHATLGDRDAAFRCLDDALKDRSGWLVYALVDPKLDALRVDERFSAVRQQIGFGSATAAGTGSGRV